MTKCKKCGTMNQETSHICINCGNSLKHKVKNKGSKTDNIILFLIILLTSVLLIGVALLSSESCTPKKHHYGSSGMGSTTLYTVTFDLNTDNPKTTVEPVKVFSGGYILSPGVEPDGDMFVVSWYKEPQCMNKFDFKSPIRENLTLYALWLDSSDKTDSDKDGVINVEEIYYGTDINNKDTDGDGLTDYFEIKLLYYNPLNRDTDGDGIQDGDEELDYDMLTNIEEQKYETRPDKIDTDGDCLNDGNEVKVYKTKPTLFDTDGDKSGDGAEVTYGTNPLVYDYVYNDITISPINSKYDSDYSAGAVIDGIRDGTALNSLSITESNIIPDNMPGYMGSAFDFNCSASFKSAEIEFTFDSSKGTYSDPTIYYYNVEQGRLEALKTKLVNVDGSSIVKAQTTVKHFSTYVLVDRAVFEQSFTWIDAWENDEKYTELELVLVIDDSGSMGPLSSANNDPEYKRLDVAKTLIDKLPENSKIGVLAFDVESIKLTESLTTDKKVAKSYLTTEYFKSDGNSTYMYDGINVAFDLFESNNKETLKMMVVLTDGAAHDANRHSATVKAANNSDVKIYTVALGPENPYFSEYLKPLAKKTGGGFYLASNADGLTEIYNKISEQIDIETDSDKDGIPNYYEENLVAFNGIKIVLDKDNPDTDGDGLLDGDEVVLTYEYSSDKSKVIVRGKYLSNPLEMDSDHDGIPDNADTAPMVKGLKGGIVGALTISSYTDGEFSSGETKGHSYLTYTSFVNDTKNIAGVHVKSPSQTMLKQRSLPASDNKVYLTADMSITLSSLGLGCGENSDGTWINNELYLLKELGVPENQVSLTVFITDSQLDMLCALASENTSWDSINNSTRFAIDVWNSVTKSKLAATSRVVTPQYLASEIAKAQGCIKGAVTISKP